MKKHTITIILSIIYFTLKAQDAIPPSGLQWYGGNLMLRLSDTSVYAHYRTATGVYKFLRLPRYREFKPLIPSNNSLIFSGIYNGLETRTIGLNLSNSNNWLAKQTITLNSSQLRLAYDSNNYADFSVSNIGNVSITPVGIGGMLTTRTFSINGFNFTAGNEESNIEVPSAQSTDNTANPLYMLGGGTSVSYRAAFGGTVNAILGPNNNYATVIFKKTFVTKNSFGGIHPIFANVAINPLVISNGIATLTNSASLFVNGTASNAVNNYSIYSIGLNRLDTVKTNRLLLNGSLGTAGQIPRIKLDGTSMEWYSQPSDSFTVGNIPFSNGAGLSQDPNFYWDNTNKRFGLGVNTIPSGRMRIGAGINTDSYNTLAVSESLSGTGNFNGINSETRVTYTGNSNNRTRGGKFVALLNPSGFSSTNVAGGALGAEGVVRIVGAGNVANATGLYGRILVDSVGATVNMSHGAAILQPYVTTGSTINYAVGLNVVNQDEPHVNNSFLQLLGTNGGSGLIPPPDGVTGHWAIYNYSPLPNYFRGKMGIGVGGAGAPSVGAWLHLKGGSNTVGNAPLKFSAGTLLSTPEAGAVEFDGTHFYGTIGSTRHQLDQQSYSFRYNASGNGSTTTITIPHGLNGISASSLIWITPKNAASGGYNYVTIDAVNVNINYITAPPAGNNNLLFDIQIKP